MPLFYGEEKHREETNTSETSSFLVDSGCIVSCFTSTVDAVNHDSALVLGFNADASPALVSNSVLDLGSGSIANTNN
ncbi:hypothetical protein EVAR_50909_1 [Eumeta japonica]|uniref:Uncharacterized protein n=1 Tax=Eumeta variegata TaxID=151549 RepID=A0A4C1YDS7_EUMVA|nr:hypothetical protein EVAR_50909_1 [Eumeta japonica]